MLSSFVGEMHESRFIFLFLQQMKIVLSLVCGIGALILGCCGGWFGLGVGALAIAFSIISRRHLGYFDTKAIVGLVLGIAGAVFGIAYIVLDLLVESSVLDAYVESFFGNAAPATDPQQPSSNNGTI